ncbi:phosphatidylserine decarboxylase family protein [Bdellovibrionota bacterium]
MRLPVAREGLPIIIGSFATALILRLLHQPVASMILFVFGVISTLFFRNPRRKTIADPRDIVCPADGKVIRVEEAYETRFLRKAAKKISIYMSSLNVHINRNPISGIVKDRKYNKGRFHLAKREKASLLNEQNAMLLEANNQQQLVLVQIAGFVARRVVCHPRPGDEVKAGESFGIIRFGSRVDLYLPIDAKINVNIGDKVKGGETIIGALNGD